VRLASSAVVIAILLPVAVRAQGNMPVGSSEQLGHISHQEDAVHRAAEAYNRGAREMRKARDAKDPADQKKHYTAAQAQFKKSLGLAQGFDALLGLGQASLALGDDQGAMTSCSEALALKPNSEEAKACADQAKTRLTAAAAPAPPPPAATPAAPPAAPPPLGVPLLRR